MVRRRKNSTECNVNTEGQGVRKEVDGDGFLETNHSYRKH